MEARQAPEPLRQKRGNSGRTISLVQKRAVSDSSAIAAICSCRATPQFSDQPDYGRDDSSETEDYRSFWPHLSYQCCWLISEVVVEFVLEKASFPQPPGIIHQMEE